MPNYMIHMDWLPRFFWDTGTTIYRQYAAPKNGGQLVRLLGGKPAGSAYLASGPQRKKKAVLQEISAVYPLKKLEEFYDIATHERFSFLYVNLLASSKEDMF